MKKQFFSPLALLLIFAGCSDPVSENADSKAEISMEETSESNDASVPWQSIDTGPFTIALPSGWIFNRLQGIDSYVGELVGDNMTLHIDAGGFAGNITNDNDPDHIITYETIDRRRAKIVVPKVTGQGMTGIYIGAHNRLATGTSSEAPVTISSADTTNFNVVGIDFTADQQEMVLQAFRTIRVNEDFKSFEKIPELSSIVP